MVFKRRMLKAMPLLNQNHSFETSPIEAKFRTLTEEFCVRARAEGLELKPYREASWARFNSLSVEQQNQKYENFSKYYSFCASSVQNGIHLRNGMSLLRRLLHQMDLRYCDDVFEQLTDDDVIEVYSMDFTQIFRNLSFLEICSYSVADLYMYEFPELFRRPHVITSRLLEHGVQVATQRPPRTLLSDVPDHFLEEIFSENRHKFYIHQKLMSSLFRDSGESAGLITSLSATPLNDLTNENFSVMNVTPLSH